MLAHLGRTGGAVQADHVDAERLERRERGADLGPDQHRARRLDGDLDDDGYVDAGRRDRAPGADRGRLGLQQVLGRLDEDRVGAARDEAARLGLVGVAERGVRRVPERRQLGARADRPEDPARAAVDGVAVGDLAGQRGARLGELLDPLGDAVLPQVGQVRAEGVGLDGVDPDREVGVVDGPDDVGARDVEDLVAALEVAEVVEGQVVGLQHRAHRAVGDDDARGERAAEGFGTGGIGTDIAPHLIGATKAALSARWLGAGRGRGVRGRDAVGRAAQIDERRQPVIEFEGLPESLPELVDPVSACAFEGWNRRRRRQRRRAAPRGGLVGHPDRGDGSRGLLRLPGQRPEVTIDDGVRSITWPTTRISVARIRSHPATWCWSRASALDALARLHPGGARRRARAPASKPTDHPGSAAGRQPAHPPRTGERHVSDNDISLRMGYEQLDVRGPTGIVGVLQDACAQAGIPAVSLWAAVPHYVAQPPCPKATLALLARIEDLLDVPVPLGDLPEESRAWQIGVDELAGEDDEIAAYVRQLEEAVDAADLPEASGDAIAREFERYLRRRSADDIVRNRSAQPQIRLPSCRPSPSR
ncbi:MAG: PAC2 family protein [Candidatus Nanopelagicales bacterium]